MIKTRKNNKCNYNNFVFIIGFYLLLMLLALIAIFGYIYFEDIHQQKYIYDETININNKKLLELVSTHSIPNSSPSFETTMPFHIDTDHIICISVKKDIITQDKERFSHLMINIINQEFEQDIIEFYLNKSTDWKNKIDILPIDAHFNDILNTVTLCESINECITREVNSISLMNVNTDSVKPFPIKAALQQLSVLVHQKEFIKNDMKLDLQTLQAYMTLAAISMLSYTDKVMKEAERMSNTEKSLSFYGGVIRTAHEFTAQMSTDLSDEPEMIHVGTIRLWAWKYNDIFVISFRGTASALNWSINFKAKAKQITFKGYGDTSDDDNDTTYSVHSGIHGIVDKYFDEIMKIFEFYNNEKRIILTGHSLGSGLAQTTLLHLLDMKNKNKVEHILYNDKVSPSLEVITFGGPPIMDKSLTESLNIALNNFNSRNEMINIPRPAVIFTKENDPITFSGVDAYKYIDSVFNDPAFGMFTSKGRKGHRDRGKLYLQYKISKAPKGKQLGKDGLKDIQKYEHFGKIIPVGSSDYNSLAKLIELAVHGEYLEAHFDSFENKDLETILNGWARFGNQIQMGLSFGRLRSKPIVTMFQ